MLFYIITNGKDYIKKNKEGKYVIIKNKKMADVFSKEMAEKILKNQISKKIRIGMHIEEANEPGKEICINKSFKDVDEIKKEMYIDESPNIQYWLDKILQINGLIDEAIKRKKELLVELSEIDKSTSDILHCMELTSLNACMGYKIYKKGGEVQRERRKIKNELELVTYIINCQENNPLYKEVFQLINHIKKRKYSPKVLKFDSKGGLI